MSQRAQEEGQGGLLLSRCACPSPVNPNERSGRRCNSGRRHSIGLRSSLLALVGVLGEVGALGNSNRGDFFVPGARTAATVLSAHVGAALAAATARVCVVHSSSQ